MNYLCLKNCMPLGTEKEKTNCFSTCYSHLEDLFKEEKYEEALGQEFLIKDSWHFSWERTLVFSLIIAVIVGSGYFLCRSIAQEAKNEE